MFTTARLKLTLWYLLILTLVSFFFSAIIYRMVGLEIERFARRQRVRVEGPFFSESFLAPDLELINETKSRFLLTLILVNGGILIISGGLSFYLADQTLKPIKMMVDEQNRFISDSSHELRTPLASLKTAFEVNLRDKKLTLADAKKLINESIIEVNQLQSLSDQLLTLASYQKPNGHHQLQPTNIKNIVSISVKKIKALALQKQITIRQSVLDTQILAHPQSLIELLTILLDNAIKYSPPKTTIKILAKLIGHQLHLSVIDQGIGIKPEDLPHLFDRFYRADTARSKHHVSGYGLGLSIAKKIADNHHAVIEVASQPNSGTTFTVKLQLVG